jgi:hypothetical protein
MMQSMGSSVRVHVESILPCAAQRAWEEVQRSALLVEITRPLMTFRPVEPPAFPQCWVEGTTLRCRLYLLGLLPLGTHTITIERIDQNHCEIHSREHNRLVKRWDHVIRVETAGEGTCRYSDEIEIEAGLLTPLVRLFAKWFYRHRQRRWRNVARRLSAQRNQGDEG